MSERDQWGWSCPDCKLAWERGSEDESKCPKCGRGGSPTYFHANKGGEEDVEK